MKWASSLQVLLLLLLGAAGTLASEGKEAAETPCAYPSITPLPGSSSRFAGAGRVEQDPGKVLDPESVGGHVGTDPRVVGQGTALVPASHNHGDPTPRLRTSLTSGSKREGGGDERSWAGGGAGLFRPSAPSRRKALPAEYRVRLGALHLGPSSPPALLAPVRRVLLPPDYSEDGARGDLALLLLRRPAPLSTRVQPVCLPEPGARPPPGTPCWVTGWGSLRPGVPLPEWRPLQGVRVPLLDARTCDHLYHQGTNVPRVEHIVLPGSLCAGYVGGQKDACQGDSGGPLVCMKSGRWVLVGVVSWGKGCALPNRPGVYTNVATYSPWIQAHLNI
nr:serine protease 33 [Odocoileus virginianus texanus]